MSIRHICLARAHTVSPWCATRRPKCDAPTTGVIVASKGVVAPPPPPTAAEGVDETMAGLIKEGKVPGMVPGMVPGARR